MEEENKVQYTFYGKVYPERSNVSIKKIHAIVRTHDDTIRGELDYYISVSQVIARFVCENTVENIYSLKNMIEDIVRIALDALGYTKGCGYDLEITVMTDSLCNPPIVFGVSIPAIERSADNAGVSFKDIMEIFKDVRGAYLRRSLADLREAIRVPKDTGFFCFRAIESLRQFFVREKGKKKKSSSWQMLRTELGVERADIEVVQELADSVRHGGDSGISDSERAKTFEITWGIINKFIKYAKADYQNKN